VCQRWVVKETQEAEIIPSDNESEAKTEQDDINRNGEHWSFEARKDRSMVAHSNAAPLTTTEASPDITAFEAFLDHDLAPVQQETIVHTESGGTRKRKSKNDEFWEGVLESEKKRLQKVSECNLTSVEEMMVGVSNGDDNGDTSLNRATTSQSKNKSREPNGASSGATFFTFS
jgi:hypothetical protein